MRIPGGDATLLIFLAALFGLFAVHYGLRLRTVLRVLRHGSRAEGRCVDQRLDTSGGSTTRHYVFAFRTPEGTEVRFEDAGSRMSGVEVGTPVRVSYDPAAPQRTATVADRDNRGPVTVPALVSAACSLVALACLAAAVAVIG